MAQEAFIADRLSLETEEGEGFSLFPFSGDPRAIGFNRPPGDVAYDFVNFKFYKKLSGDEFQWDEGLDGVSEFEGKVPFCLAGGAEANISLVNGQIPFCLADGSEANIELV